MKTFVNMRSNMCTCMYRNFCLEIKYLFSNNILNSIKSVSFPKLNFYSWAYDALTCIKNFAITAIHVSFETLITMYYDIFSKLAATLVIPAGTMLAVPEVTSSVMPMENVPVTSIKTMCKLGTLAVSNNWQTNKSLFLNMFHFSKFCKCQNNWPVPNP